jgi:hypothetical protein
VELIEAVDDQGRALEPLPEEPAPPMKEPVVENDAAESWQTLRMKLPAKDAQKIARLRGAFAVRVPVESATYALGVDGKASDDALEITVEAGQKARRGSPSFVARVKPKSLEEFLKQPIDFRAKLKDGGERLCTASGKVSGGAVDYTLTVPQSYRDQVEGRTPEVEGITAVVHRKLAERKIRFEFRDIALK